MASKKKPAKAATQRVSDLLVDLRSAMRRAGDPARATAQQAYMKSEMPYHGLRSAETRAICKEQFASYTFDSFEQWTGDVLAIWRGANKREERYAALHLAGKTKAKPFHTMDALPMFEEMIVTGAWWDYVDELASHNLSLILKNDTKTMRRTMLVWSKCDDIWKRRSSIICQLPFKEDTDLDLLYACIEPSISRKEFWLRKAIGWALRQHGWTDSDEIRRYVAENEDRLSPLSKKEALKNIGAVAATSSRPRAKKRKTS